MPNDVFVAIILVNWNQSDYTIACVNSLKAITYPYWKLIIVDNGSNDRELEKLNHIEDCHLILNSTNRGFTGGNNDGINYAIDQGYEYIMLLNNDTIVTPNFLEPLIDNLLTDNVGAVQPLIYYLDRQNIIWNFGGFYNPMTGKTRSRKQGGQDDIERGTIYKTKWITGCCMLIKKSCLEKVGLLDDRYFSYYEDVDWCFRAKYSGFELLCIGDSKIYHAVGASGKNKLPGEGDRSPQTVKYSIRNHILLLKDHSKGMNRLSVTVFQLLKISRHILFYLVKWRWRKLKSVIEGVREGLYL